MKYIGEIFDITEGGKMVRISVSEGWEVGGIKDKWRVGSGWD